MEDFRHKKSLGQNFLTDKNLLSAIVSDAKVEGVDTVIEIGTGMGALTSALIEKSGKVISYEADLRLREVLEERFKNADNLSIIYKDILLEKAENLREVLGDGYKLVANLPYYITTPIIFYFVEKVGGCHSLTLMVQKEFAERLTAKPACKDYGAVTVTLGAEFNISMTRSVSRKLFNPPPNVDSAVVTMRRRKEVTPFFREFVRQAFSMRRKTLVNNLSSRYPKEKILAALDTLSLPLMVRGEALTIETFEKLASLLNAT